MTGPVPARCVFDTDVLNGLLDERDAHHEAAVELVVDLTGGKTELLISAVNYGEVMVRPSREVNRLARAIDALRGAGFRILPVDAVTAVVAAGARADGVSLADAFALAAAAEERAALASFDERVRRTAELDGLQVLPA